MKEKVWYVDGACSGNPGAGGWACVEVKINQVHGEPQLDLFQMTGGKAKTTNNEMELTAFYQALLESYKKKTEQVTVHSDSAYVVNAIDKGWLMNWYSNGWKTVEGKPVKNRNIWEKVYKLVYRKGMAVRVKKVYGHKGDMLNEYADRLAVYAKEAQKEE